jgi:hypothetical protein
MSQFEINLASPEDDAALRGLLESTPMSGDIGLAFARQPSYFAATAIDGHHVHVVKVQDKSTGRIVGMGSRSIFRAFVNGVATDVGYLSGLRLLPEHRKRAGLLARGFRKFRELHADGRAAYYLTTVAADNHESLAVLTSQRAGLPVYHPWGRCHTLTFVAGRSRRTLPARVSIRRATPEDANMIEAFLHEQGPRRQFFPILDQREFAGQPQRLMGLSPESILLAWAEGQLVGTLGLWDQRPFKQTMITSYSRRLLLSRPFYNAVAGLQSKPQLPRVGKTLNLRYAAVPVVRSDYIEAADHLIDAATRSLRQDLSELLLLGLHERDPLLERLRLLSGKEYVTLMFLVYWPDEPPDVERLACLPPYLELGCL